MATVFHTQVLLDSIKNEEFNRTWAYSGTLTAADAGKAVTLDATVKNTVKLAGDGDVIIGRLEVVETGRKTCTVQHRFSDTLPVKSGETIAIGDTVVGAGAGEVKKLTTGGSLNINYVAEVRTGFVVVIKL